MAIGAGRGQYLSPEEYARLRRQGMTPGALSTMSQLAPNQPGILIGQGRGVLAPYGVNSLTGQPLGNTIKNTAPVAALSPLPVTEVAPPPPIASVMAGEDNPEDVAANRNPTDMRLEAGTQRTPMEEAMNPFLNKDNANAVFDGLLQGGIGMLANASDPKKALAAGLKGFGSGFDSRTKEDKANNVPKVVPLAGGRGALLVYPDGRMEEKSFPELTKLLNNPYGTAPKGYRFDADGNLEVIPGGPADDKAKAAKSAADLKAQNLIDATDNVMSTVDEMLTKIENSKAPLIGDTTTGATGAALGMLPGTAAYDVRQSALTIKANLGFDRLQQMRDASTTGGALGQVAVQELNALQSTIASVDPNQSPQTVKDNLQKVKDQYAKWKQAFQASRSEVGGSGQPAPKATGGSGGGTKKFDSIPGVSDKSRSYFE